MPIPPYVGWLREHIGHAPLWLTGVTGVILRERPDGGSPLVLLVRRSDTGRYALVSGIVDPGEHPADTIVREADEEAYVAVEVDHLVDVQVVGPIEYPNGDVASYVDHAYRCRWIGGDARPGDDEATEAGWWPVDELPELSDGHRRLVDMVLAGDVGAHLRPPPR